MVVVLFPCQLLGKMPKMSSCYLDTGITCDHRGVRELTDFGNLSTVNQKPVTFVIGTNNMPHEGEYITSYNCY